MKEQEANANPALKPDCFLVQCKPYQTKYPWDQLKWSVYWAFRLS